ncbi:MAG: tRNA lysidine(34) synthetase TilS, partial [Bacteroidetes bacterium]|nr:tRNA lysidine(34) synthetase TilS [Bacteroidota bacterium]
MFNQFGEFVDAMQLHEADPKFLLAVSGGVDSTVLAWLFHQKKLSFGIAHCNFQLREEASDGDEAFVNDLGDQLSVEVHTKRFDTEKYGSDEGISVQMAARELRYKWFSEVKKENGYSHLVTAHHKDDSVETFMINLVRGTGIAGLHGILSGEQNVIRPLLFAEKEEVLAYAKEHSIAYREDATNSSTKYLRNKMRLEVIPALEALNPNFKKAISDNIEVVKDIEKVLANQLDKFVNEVVDCGENHVSIDIEKLKKCEPINFYLYAFLKSYGFNGSDVKNIILSLDGESGKVFNSSTHRLLKDREKLIITLASEHQNKDEYEILEDDISINYPVHMIFISEVKDKVSKSKEIATFDFDKLSFPLKLRRWKDGDKFVPLGMQT